MTTRTNTGLGGLLLVVLSLFTSCSQEKYQEKPLDPEYYRRSVKQLTDVIVHDIFSPPVASRIYVYPNIAAYEILARQNEEHLSLHNQLTDFSPIPAPDTTKAYSHSLASIHALITVGKALVFSEDKMNAFRDNLYQEIREKENIPEQVFKHSVAYGQQVAEHVLAWANEDNYKETRTFPKYTVKDEPGAWKPTPPDFMEGIEPHWNKIRPMVIDSARQFIPEYPPEFSMDEGSEFYEDLMEVYNAVNNLNEEELEIAKFWDCNPYVSVHRGHAMFAIKKITPGGHWIGVTAIASRKANLDLMKTAEAYTRVSIALFDGFISCWDEKWRSILIRPETLINAHIDEEWKPVLQTPPFPEYTSGHSVISNAAAVTLTDLLGEPFNYTDTTELEYGLPARSYNSFMQAASEAAISRLYGGIHYMPAITNGATQGKAVGRYIAEKLKTRKGNTAKTTNLKPLNTSD